jgi:hypothetical protein
LAQRERLRAGMLGRESVSVNDYFIHRKERVLLTKDSSLYGLHAGDTGTVTKATPKSLSIFLDSGKVVRIPLKQYEAIQPAYAMTHDQALGHSTRRAFILFEGLNPAFELKEIGRRARVSQVSAYAQVNAAERAFDEIKRAQEMRQNQFSEHQRRHDHDHSFSH